jgi:hypothetical protein
MQIEDLLAQLAAGSEKTGTEAEKTAAAASTTLPEGVTAETLALAKALTEDKEALAALKSMGEDSEKTAEAEKLAEELEFQGRLFARGLIAEQTKIAYLADQIDEEAVIKTAEALNMTLPEIMGEEKLADAHTEAYSAAKNNSGAGHVEVPLNAHARPVAKAEELKGLAAVANALKKVKTQSTDQPVNG